MDKRNVVFFRNSERMPGDPLPVPEKVRLWAIFGGSN